MVGITVGLRMVRRSGRRISISLVVCQMRRCLSRIWRRTRVR